MPNICNTSFYLRCVDRVRRFGVLSPCLEFTPESVQRYLPLFILADSMSCPSYRYPILANNGNVHSINSLCS